MWNEWEMKTLQRAQKVEGKDDEEDRECNGMDCLRRDLERVGGE